MNRGVSSLTGGGLLCTGQAFKIEALSHVWSL